MLIVKRSLGYLLWKTVFAALGATLLIIFVPPVPIAILVCALLGFALLFLQLKDLALLVVTGMLLTLVMEGAVRLMGDRVLMVHYRPHEILAEGERYRANQRLEMNVAHGDLIAADPHLPESLAEPRLEIFQTDSLGYRNDSEYSGQKLLVVGDSFIAANGNTQEDTLTAQLWRNHSIAAYNLGFVAGPLGYSERIAWARAELPSSTCLALFFFEGNDFQMIQESEALLRTRVPSFVQDAVVQYVSGVRSLFSLSRVSYGLWTRSSVLRRGGADGDQDSVAFVRRVGARDMGFLRGYAEVVRRSDYEDFDFIENLLRGAPPDILLFIPDKYRVYGPLSEGVSEEVLPNAQWKHLEEVALALDIPAVDLTSAMVKKAVELLPLGETVFWRDDTHWNEAGIAVGAAVLADALRAHPSLGCRSAVSEN